jgi:monofunctional biosynthetic peptidoglycan transglycosylase
MARKGLKKKKTSLWIKIVILILAVIVCDLAWYSFVVDIKQYEKKNPKKTAFMKYRERQWREKKRTMEVKQIWAPLGSISMDARKAVVVAEDAKFWMHDGFDFDAMRKAVEKNIAKRKMAVGASTISMQVAKNLFLSPSKTPVRKIHEAILTWRMERILTKKRILELYLNIAEWGDGIFGIELASQTYFHHSASMLDKSESALLAAVLPNPIRFNPLKNSRFVVRRSRLIRNAMGGDVNAAIALHRYTSLNEVSLDVKQKMSSMDSVELLQIDSVPEMSISKGDSTDTTRLGPAISQDSVVNNL